MRVSQALYGRQAESGSSAKPASAGLVAAWLSVGLRPRGQVRHLPGRQQDSRRSSALCRPAPRRQRVVAHPWRAPRGSGVQPAAARAMAAATAAVPWQERSRCCGEFYCNKLLVISSVYNECCVPKASPRTRRLGAFSPRPAGCLPTLFPVRNGPRAAPARPPPSHRGAHPGPGWP